MLLGNDAKGVELGVESSLRWRDEFKSFTRKVKAMNDTDDVVDELVIFSNERFTREIEIERERERDFFLFFSLQCIFRSKYRCETLLVLADSSNLPSSSRKLGKWEEEGEAEWAKKARNGKTLDAPPWKFGSAHRPDSR